MHCGSHRYEFLTAFNSNRGARALRNLGHTVVPVLRLAWNWLSYSGRGCHPWTTIITIKFHITFSLPAGIYDYLERKRDCGVHFTRDLSRLSCRHRYSQYLRAQLVDGDGREVKSTKSSFYHYMCSLEWVPAFRPVEGDRVERKYLRPTSVYLSSPEVSSLLGTHVCYTEITPSDFSRAIGKLLLPTSQMTTYNLLYTQADMMTLL